MGPHGLVIGATGSGKSELLRTLVLGLALTHSSETLNFVLVDFKGGATFAGLDVTAAHVGGHHQPRGRADPRRPHEGRDPGRDGAPPGGAARGGQLRLAARLRAGPRAGRAARADAVAVHRRRRVQRAAVGQARLHRAVRDDRPARPLARRAPAAGLAAPGGGPAARPGHPPVLPDRPAHVLGDGEPRRARRARRLRAARRTRQRLPQGGDRGPGPVQGGLRLGRVHQGGERPGRRSATPSGARCCRTSSTTSPRARRPALLEDEARRRARRAGRSRRDDARHPRRPACRARGTPARKVWLPPLDVPPTLDELLPPLRETELGLRPVDWDPMPTLSAPIGLIDRPFDQRRDPHWVEPRQLALRRRRAARRAARARCCAR